FGRRLRRPKARPQACRDAGGERKNQRSANGRLIQEHHIRGPVSGWPQESRAPPRVDAYLNPAASKCKMELGQYCGSSSPKNVRISAVSICFYCLTVFTKPYGPGEYALEQSR